MKEIIEKGKLTEFFRGPFELIDRGFSTGEENMRIDRERTEQVAAGNALPFFRLYGWEPWAVSLGANQKEADIDAGETRKRNFDIVRRPTGGRAVLHANELTYAVVMNLPEDMTMHDAYREIHIILLEGLNNLGGAELSFEKSQPDFRKNYRESGMSVSCFASSARYEIEHNGRKIVGSAQRVFGRTLLQHGSILLGPGHEQLAFVIRAASQDRRQALYEFTKKHSATMSEVCGRDIGYREAADAVMESVAGNR